MNEIPRVLDDNEQVLWEGKPKFWPYFFSQPWLFIFLFALAWNSFIFPAFLNVRGSLFLTLFFIPFLLVGIGMLITPFAIPLAYLNLHYAITDKRVIEQSGLIGRDYQSVDFDQITDLRVRVDLAHKIFGNCGTIKVSAEPKPIQLDSIPRPYQVFKHLKKAAFDVKSDMEFPNQLRPDENPGYQTEYKG